MFMVFFSTIVLLECQCETTYIVIYPAGKVRLIKTGESISSISLDDLRKFFILFIVSAANDMALSK